MIHLCKFLLRQFRYNESIDSIIVDFLTSHWIWPRRLEVKFQFHWYINGLLIEFFPLPMTDASSLIPNGSTNCFTILCERHVALHINITPIIRNSLRNLSIWTVKRMYAANGIKHSIAVRHKYSCHSRSLSYDLHKHWKALKSFHRKKVPFSTLIVGARRHGKWRGRQT